MQSGAVPIPFNGPLSVDAAAALRPGIIFESASRAHNGGVASDGVYTTQEFANLGHAGAQFVINISDKGAAGTLVVKVQIYDPGQAGWVDLPEATTASLNADGSTVLTVHPGIEEDANSAIAQALPARWRLHATVGTNAVVFSVSGVYLP